MVHEICANYIDIFLSPILDLRSRIVLCGKVSFSFRIWRLWLKNGDHGVLGNSQKLVEEKKLCEFTMFFGHLVIVSFYCSFNLPFQRQVPETRCSTPFDRK